NEFYEGEALFPDNGDGRSRVELATSIVQELRDTRPTATRPTAVLLCDDVLPLARLFSVVRAGTIYGFKCMRTFLSRALTARAQISHSVSPSSLPVAQLPANRIVLAAARALAEEELRLPSGWQNPSFHWLRGTARPLSVENGCIRLRYPEVVEERRS